MDILRFTTAGDVDDGKSTLIGRLLYDTHSLKTDVLDSVSAGREAVNLAHITDGLRSERTQGITIDVAYKYYTTATRKYIITDAPGHFQYTRNLVTGASMVDAIIILIDIEHGITEQTRRHLLVASFLQISHVVVAVNKMDLVAHRQSVFDAVRLQFAQLAERCALRDVSFIPVSALQGDNVSFPSANMPWYTGLTLEQYLGQCTAKEQLVSPLRCSVQYALGDNLFAARLLSGKLSKGDLLTVATAQATVTVDKILEGYDEVTTAEAGANIVIGVSGTQLRRGDLLAHATAPPQVGNRLVVDLCWLNSDQDLIIGAQYWLGIASFETKCHVSEIVHKTDLHSFDPIPGVSVSVNEFARVVLETADPVASDSCSSVPATGRGILIHPGTNYTSGAFTVV